MAASTTRVDVDFTRELGPVASLSGVQGSPLPEVAGDRDHRELFLRYGISNARFPQDCRPNTLTLGGIFPDESADPDRADSYRFSDIDAHVSAARAAGAQILWQSSYDVGRSDRWVDWNLGGRAPRDPSRWIRVVRRCLEHFNNGWAAGTQGMVRNVEFLNEPDGLGGFGTIGIGKIAPAFETFLAGMAAYNREHPSTPVRAVGPGIPLSLAEWRDWKPRFQALLGYLRQRSLDLPVFSFHTYGADTSPRSNAALAAELRHLLDASGFPAAELWNTEWQATDYLRKALAGLWPIDRAPAETELRAYMAAIAAYAVSCKIRWQGSLQGSYYYRVNVRPWPEGHPSTPHAGYGVFFSPEGIARPLAMQELLFARIAQQTPQRCPAELHDDDGLVSVMASRSLPGDRACVLLSNPSSLRRKVDLRMQAKRNAGLRAPRVLEIGPLTDGLAAGTAPAIVESGGALVTTIDLEPFGVWCMQAGA